MVFGVSQGARTANETKLCPVNVESFLDSGELADFEFVVKSGDQNQVIVKRFRVHKQFLAMRNEVFRAMFYGDIAEKSHVTITDIHPDGFELLLRFLYSGKMKMASIDDALRTRFAAKKYLVEQLEEACSAYIKKNLSAGRLCSFIDYYMRNSYPDMDGAVAAILNSDKAPAVLASKEFNVALEETVRYIVDKIRNVPEHSVACAVFGWAQEQCLRSLQTDRPLELKTLVRSFFPKIRFLTMTMEEFLNGPGSWGVLDDAQIVGLLRGIVSRGWGPLPAGFSDVIIDRFNL
ncbi:BTB/POZ domain-containing protein 6-like [Dermacentor variabilis]|uniref:BTB/POZ domain-containing protein 6-like n=1 Tax=Dermacentor variabilis TaxID=34621 RepID=UPI003F5C8BBF